MNKSLLGLSCLVVFAGLLKAQKMELKPVTEPVIHGEGPHWDYDKLVLYYVDIQNQTVNSYDPRTGKTSQVFIEGGPVTPVIPVQFEEDGFVLGRGLDLVWVQWDGKSQKPSDVKILASIDRDKPKNRFNDGKVDSSGRLWAGTMGPEVPKLELNQGSLFSFEPYDHFTPLRQLTPVSVSNGLAWNNNDSVMYYVDSPTRNVDAFDFDIIEGKISNRRILFGLEENNITGVPDGMAIDEDENLWVAVYAGGCVLHIDTKQGTLIDKIDLPAARVTSCVFGGADLEDLYITTSQLGLSAAEKKQQPKAGSVFKLSGTGIKGQRKPNKLRIF